jgi:hypothetical protein
LDRPDEGDWARGGYRVWVENTSCADGTFADSDAVVTVSRSGGEFVRLPVSGAAGDKSLETWGVGSVFMDTDGSMAIVGTQSTFGDPCGPPPPPVVGRAKMLVRAGGGEEPPDRSW